MADAVLIAHDGRAGWKSWPARTGTVAALRYSNISPFAIFGENIVKYDQIKRRLFLDSRISGWPRTSSADNFAFISLDSATGPPGYDASEDLPKVKDCIRDPAPSQSLGYYWGQSLATGSAQRQWWPSRPPPGAGTSTSLRQPA